MGYAGREFVRRIGVRDCRFRLVKAVSRRATRSLWMLKE